VKYLPLFHHFKAIYQFPKHIIFLVKIPFLVILLRLFDYLSQRLFWLSNLLTLSVPEVGYSRNALKTFFFRGCPGRDRMVVGFTTTYAISAYHH
jgi:hypothetical protein